MGAVHECFRGLWTERGVGHLNTSSPSALGHVFSIILCLLALAIEHGLLLRHILLHVNEHLEELGFISSWWVYISSCPLRRCEDNIFHNGDELEVAQGSNALAVATDLSFEVVPSPAVGYFFGAMARWRGFLKMSLVGEKSELCYLDLNGSTNLWWSFSD